MVHGVIPKYLQDLLIPCVQPLLTKTPRCFKFVLPQIKQPFFWSILHSTLKLWNELPLQIWILPTVSSFQKAIKTYILESQTNLMTLETIKKMIYIVLSVNNARNLHADLYNHFVRENSICDTFGYVSENVYHYNYLCLST